MQAVVSRSYKFCASHRLHSTALSMAENSRIYGKCNNPYGHGHDYLLDVSIAGDVDQTTGLVIRLATLDDMVQKEVLVDLSHRNLNHDVPEFLHQVPTTENLALVIADRLMARWSAYVSNPSAWLSGIRIQETERNSFEVAMPAPKFATSPGIEESVVVNA